MSFWDQSSGKKTEATTELDQDTSMPPIPAGTCVKCAITEAKWDEYEGVRNINIKWEVIDGEYKGRVIFHKVKVCDEKATKRDKAIEMLAAIDMICSQGALMSSGEEPTDMSLMRHLSNKPVVIRLQVWDFNDKTGNWVDGVWAGNGPTAKAAPAAATKDVDPNEDIGF